MRQALALALLLAGPLFGAGRQLPSVASEAALPASGNTLGDRRGTEDTGIEYWWDGDSWEVMATEAAAHAATHASGGADALSGTLDVNISGNAATATAATSATSATSATTASTATALAANGANCSAGSYPLGVDASGAAESCTAVTATNVEDFATADTNDGYVLTSDGLGGVAFEAAAGGGIVGSTGATDDALLCSDGTGGATLQACGQVVSPAQISATLTDHVADWAPTGIETASTILVTPSGARRVILGISGGVAGRLLLIINVSATHSLGLGAEQVSSAAANRIVDSYEIGPKGGALLVYDGTASRWRAVGQAAFSYGATLKVDLGGASGGVALQAGAGLNAGGNGIALTSNSDVSWTSGDASATSREVGLRRVSSGVLGVHIGDGATFTATIQAGETLLTPATSAPSCSPGLSYYDDGDDDFCDCVGSSPAWRSRGGAGDCNGI